MTCLQLIWHKELWYLCHYVSAIFVCNLLKDDLLWYHLANIWTNLARMTFRTVLLKICQTLTHYWYCGNVHCSNTFLEPAEEQWLWQGAIGLNKNWIPTLVFVPVTGRCSFSSFCINKLYFPLHPDLLLFYLNTVVLF